MGSRRRRWMTVSAAVLLLCVMAATVPAVVGLLMPPLPEDRPDAAPAAVVVLAGGRIHDAKGWRMSSTSRRRLLTGIDEARRRHLPLLLSGGTVSGKGTPEARLMADLARRVAPNLSLIIEDHSRNTWQNAVFSSELLRLHGIRSVVLVTDRSHLPRAMLCFHSQGVETLPVAATSLPKPLWVPSTRALAMLPAIWYEWAALVWYDIKYF